MRIHASVQVSNPAPGDLRLYRNSYSLDMSGVVAREGSGLEVTITTHGPGRTREVAARLRDLADEMDAAAAMMPVEREAAA